MKPGKRAFPCTIIRQDRVDHGVLPGTGLDCTTHSREGAPLQGTTSMIPLMRRTLSSAVLLRVTHALMEDPIREPLPSYQNHCFRR